MYKFLNLVPGFEPYPPKWIIFFFYFLNYNSVLNTPTHRTLNFAPKMFHLAIKLSLKYSWRNKAPDPGGTDARWGQSTPSPISIRTNILSEQLHKDNRPNSRKRIKRTSQWHISSLIELVSSWSMARHNTFNGATDYWLQNINKFL